MSASAVAGQAAIAWAEDQMPVLGLLRERFAQIRPLAGLRVGACLHLTAETACLVKTLTVAGAQVALCAANPLATRDDVVAALAAEAGVSVYGHRGDSLDDVVAHVLAVLDSEPQVTIDDGADLIVTLHGVRPDLLAAMLGGTEETASGLVRLRAMEADRRLELPVIAVNEARAERVFNDHYGTGQSVIDGILRATNLLLAGRTVVVLGYGTTGRGIAARARGSGAQVIVCEVDPVAALAARMEGFRVLPALAAAASGDVFITVTGAPAVLGAEHFAEMHDGAVLANAGHFDVEIDIAALGAAAVEEPRAVRPLVDRYRLADGRRLNLLANGRVVNLAAGEGHPASVMDVSFGLQALSIEYIAESGDRLPVGVAPVPSKIDREVARLKLESLGVGIDELSAQQREYLRRWA